MDRGILGHIFWAVFCGIGTLVGIMDATNGLYWFAAILTSIACIGNIYYAVKLIKQKQNDRRTQKN